MSSFQALEQQVLAFLRKCDELMKKRTQVTNFDEIADQYLGDGEAIEDDIDKMMSNPQSFSKEQLGSLAKLKADIGKALDQLESVDVPQTPQKPKESQPPVVNSTVPAVAPVVPPVPASLQPMVPPIAVPTHVPPVHVQQTGALPAVTAAVVESHAQVPVAQTQAQSTVHFQQAVTNQMIQPSSLPANIKQKSGNEIWQIVKNDNSSRSEQVFASLKAAGAFPSGFRPSFLQKIIDATRDLYLYSNFLAPKATPHCLSFKDAAFGSGVGKILNHGAAEPRHLRTLTIMSCNNMFPLNANSAAAIEDRILRVCLVDGERILSNIHTIRVSGTSDPEKRNWIFDTAVNDFALGMNFGEIFIKCDSKSTTLAVLFECSYVVKTPGSADACLVSCGWYLQPLIENNEPIRKGNFEGLLCGGMPLEFNTGLGTGAPQPAPAQRPKKPSSLKNSKDPYIVFKLAEFHLDRELVDTAPDTLIGCTLHLPAFDFYCDSLISFLSKREHPQWAGRVHNPFLSTFPLVADQPDIMDVVKILWVDASKKLSRQERKDDQLVRTRFISTYLSLVIPALGSVVLGNKFDWLRTLSNKGELEARRVELGAMLDVLRQNKSPFQLININFKPLQPSEYMLDLQSPNCFTVVS